MSWIVQSKDAAEKAGADMKNDEAMYVITPTAVGEIFNNHMADQDPGGEWNCVNPPDYWEQLADADREEYLDAVWRHIDKRMTNVDEDIRDVFEHVKKEMEQRRIPAPGAEKNQEEAERSLNRTSP